MGYLIIPTKDAQTLGSFDQTVSLEGVDYQLWYRYNDREGFWYVDLLDTEDNPIKTGMKLVSNWPLYKNLKVSPRPPGEMILVDTRSIPVDGGFDELGVDTLMGYIEEDSLP